jgi:hypothetical protein
MRCGAPRASRSVPSVRRPTPSVRWCSPGPRRARRRCSLTKPCTSGRRSGSGRCCSRSTCGWVLGSATATTRSNGRPGSGPDGRPSAQRFLDRTREAGADASDLRELVDARRADAVLGAEPIEQGLTLGWPEPLHRVEPAAGAGGRGGGGRLRRGRSLDGGGARRGLLRGRLLRGRLLRGRLLRGRLLRRRLLRRRLLRGRPGAATGVPETPEVAAEGSAAGAAVCLRTTAFFTTARLAGGRTAPAVDDATGAAAAWSFAAAR